MYWQASESKEVTAKEVKDLPVGTHVHLEGRDRYGALTQIEGRVAYNKNGQKQFLYYDCRMPVYKDIRTYKGKRWLVLREVST